MSAKKVYWDIQDPKEAAYRQGIKDAEDIFHRMHCDCRGKYCTEQWWGKYWDVRKEMQMAASRGYRVSLLRSRDEGVR